MTKLEVRLLGGFTACLDGKVISSFGTSKGQALLSYLMVESSRPHKREYLAGLLWGEQEQEKALHSLRQAVSALRRSIADDDLSNPFLFCIGDEIQFNSGSNYGLDLEVFDRMYLDGVPTKDHRIDITQLQNAEKIYSGSFLEQFTLKEAEVFEEWASLTREAYSQKLITLVECLCDYHEKRGEFHLGREYAARLVRCFPWNENAHLQLIRLYALDGQYTAAENQYSFCKKYLEDQLSLPPTEELEKLYQDIRERSIKPTKWANSNLLESIHQLSGKLIGREQELSELTTLLSRYSTHLITIHGPGGIGKTCLAQEIATSQVGIFPDGVFFVSLVGITDADQVPSIVARSMGLVISNREEVSTQLNNFLSNKQVLLVIDNSDTLNGAAETLSNWIQSIPGLVLLVTSRERLNLRDEIVFPLQGLRYPDCMNVEEIQHYPAVQLFMEHMYRVGKKDLSHNEIHAIMDICQRMEGLPLGLELAAALTWNKPVAEIAYSIESNLDQIKTNYPDIPARHRSLESVFDYSWDLLSPQLKDQFVSLAIFPADFNFVSAQEICGLSEENLKALINKSLLRVNISGRYELHSLIKRFICKQLADDERGLSERLKQKFVQYFTLTLEKSQLTPLSDDLFDQVSQLQKDFPSIHQAWFWALDACQFDVLFRLVPILHTFYTAQSRFEECHRLFVSTNELLHSDAAQKLSARLHIYLGSIEHILSKRPDLVKYLQNNVDRVKTLGIEPDIIYGLTHLVSAIKNRKQYKEARALAQQALELSLTSQNDWGIANSNYMLGSIAHQCGEIQPAIQHFNICLDISRRHHAPLIMMMALNALGDVYCHIGDYQLGRQMFEECLEISRRLGTHYQISIHLNNLGTIDQVEGHLDSAIVLFNESLDECHLIGDEYGEAITLCNLGEIAITQEKVEEADSLFKRAVRIGQETEDDYVNEICYTNLAEIARVKQNLPEAVEMIQRAVELANDTDMLPKLMTAFVYAAHILFESGKIRESEAILHLVVEHDSTEELWRENAKQYLESLHQGYHPDGKISLEMAVEIIRQLKKIPA